jgi:EAL domain-containing protein (putative c-di-GMP-specific phosphodiesterase class I)
VGDQLFQETARRLKARVGERGMVARLTGDNFAILLDHAPGFGAAQQFAEDLQRDFGTPFPVAGHEVYTSASIGIVADLSGYTSADDVLRDADTANHSAKLLGRGNHRCFDAAMRNDAVSLYELENKLRGALGNDEFRMFYQPIVRTGDASLAGFEALVRWRAPGTQAISPSEFVPVSEDMGLIIPLGRWVLQEACRQMQDWLVRHPDGAGLKISVNLSARQFAQPDLLTQIDAALEQTGLPAHCLKLEITETALMENSDLAAQQLAELRQRGIQVLLDDFGTGYSSLSYLHRFPLDAIKIDASFVASMDKDDRSAAIVRAVVALAHGLGMEVIAEGVETSSQLDKLRGLGVQYGQGYLFSRPVDARGAETFVS